MPGKPEENKVISPSQFGLCRTWRDALVKNWCLQRSKVVYAIATHVCSGEVRINIAMRCRDNTATDWGHAWVTYNGQPLWERRASMVNKPKTMIADTGKYIYWIYN